MNLTKRQVEALAENLTKEINKGLKKKRDEFKKTFKVTLTAQEKAKALKDAEEHKFQTELSKAYKTKGINEPYYLQREIEGKIIVASIDSTDLESLTKAILKDYK